MWSDFDLESHLQGQTITAKVKSTYNLLIIDPRDLETETNLLDIMGWESSDVVRFYLEPHIQGQMMVH